MTAAPVPSVRDVILDRLERGSTPRQRDDEHKVALVVEGGGMRGAVSSGMLLALEQLGLRNSFDEVVGTSAGAIAGAFFVTGKGTAGSVLYYTVLNSSRFVDRRRLWRSGAVLDLDYLFDDALPTYGLSWPDLIDSDIPLYATVSPVDNDNHRHLFHVGETPEHAKAVLVASSNLPVLGGGSRPIGHALYVDGGMIAPVPWVAAVERGATHVLVARSRGFNASGAPEGPNVFERATVPRMVRRLHGEHVAELVDDAPTRFFEVTEALKAVWCGDARPVADAGKTETQIDVVLPSPDAVLPDRLEVDTHLLMDALTAGAQALVEYLDIEGFSVEQRVVVTHPRAPIGRVRSTALAPIVTERRRYPR